MITTKATPKTWLSRVNPMNPTTRIMIGTKTRVKSIPMMRTMIRTMTSVRRTQMVMDQRKVKTTMMIMMIKKRSLTKRITRNRRTRNRMELKGEALPATVDQEGLRIKQETLDKEQADRERRHEQALIEDDTVELAVIKEVEQALIEDDTAELAVNKEVLTRNTEDEEDKKTKEADDRAKVDNKAAADAAETGALKQKAEEVLKTKKEEAEKRKRSRAAEIAVYDKSK
jgi:hypothetical protein